jgi:hypothetical protein
VGWLKKKSEWKNKLPESGFFHQTSNPNDGRVLSAKIIDTMAATGITSVGSGVEWLLSRLCCPSAASTGNRAKASARLFILTM